MRFIKLLRPTHWIKNFLLFLPLIFSGQMLNPIYFCSAIWGLAAFCLLCSSIYILNDLNDIASDQAHPTKRNRPLASGVITRSQALFVFVALVLLCALCNFFASGLNAFTWICIFSYAGINIAYSRGFKNIPIIDIAILALGFLLRLLYGSALFSIKISDWLYLTTISFAFYMGLGKRRNEIKKGGSASRRVLAFYQYAFLDKFMYVCLGLTIAFYSLWAISASDGGQLAQTQQGGGLVWTVPLVMLICMRYSMLIEDTASGDPVDVLMSDKFLLIMVALYAICMAMLLY